MLELSPKELELDDGKLEAFQKFMKRKREEAGFRTQQDAARAIGVSQDVISRTESRFSANMRIGEFSMILNAYNIAPGEAFLRLGLYADPPIPDPEHVEYVRKEILPLFDDRSIEQLRRIKMVIKGFFGPINNE